MKGESWREELYLLARWGDALESWEALCQKASQVIRTAMNDRASIIANEIQRFREQLDGLSDSAIITGKVTLPSLHGGIEGI